MTFSFPTFLYAAKTPRTLTALVAGLAWTILFISLGMQWTLDLTPCPMCIVQRYCIMALAITTSLALLLPRIQTWLLAVAFLFTGLGAFTAARQSLLQWNPPEFMTCGRDFYGMVEAFPLSKLVPAIFAGSGDCASSAENLFGITLANASFVFFALALFALGRLLWKAMKP